MKHTNLNMLRSTKGATAIEYALQTALMGLCILVILGTIGSFNQSAFINVTVAMNGGGSISSSQRDGNTSGHCEGAICVPSSGIPQNITEEQPNPLGDQP